MWCEHVWDNHLGNFAELFQRLYQDSALLDVTLACRGGSLRTHKLVLSACSPYFKQVFEENPCKHPTIIMPTVGKEDMGKLLEFMYRGRITLPMERTQVILRLAADLQLKGFDNFDSTGGGDAVSAATIRQEQDSAQKQQMPKSILKKEVMPRTSPILITNGRKIDKDNNISNEPADADEHSEHDNEEPGENYECEICKRIYKTPKDLQKHKKIHQDKNFSCEFCNKLFSRASHLIRHRRVHTGERPFNCSYCGKDFARQDKLKLHIRTSHQKSPDCSTNSLPTNHTNLIGKPSVHFKCDLDEDDYDEHESEQMDDHITLESFTNAEKHPEKRGRGRPKKIKLSSDVLLPKKHRGRRRKEVGNESSTDNYDLSNLPYGDINYLTMSPTIPMEPLVEIKIKSDADINDHEADVINDGDVEDDDDDEEMNGCQEGSSAMPASSSAA